MSSPPNETLGSKLISLFRGGESGEELARLPGSAREAAAIAALLPAASVDRLEGFTATRERFLAAGLGRYRFIHIATHAVADAEVPQASALILSRFDAQSRQIDGNVLAADFMPLQLSAQTVVLSACDTALGKNIAGEGLIGLRYVVLARGAESVVSSLWPIADQVTAQVMSRFYPLLLNGTRVEAALGSAMRTMIQGNFSDPAWWSAFALTVRGAQGS
jgi:CHAT domain-containing protein